MAYAQNTKISQDKTISDIRTLLKKAGATGIRYASSDEPPLGMVEFEMQGKRIRFVIELPSDSEPKAEQAARQRWRALLLVIKAKLVSVEEKVVTFEEEFLSHFVLPNNQTIYETIKPQLPEITATGKLPPMLLPGTGGK